MIWDSVMGTTDDGRRTGNTRYAEDVRENEKRIRMNKCGKRMTSTQER